MIPCNEDKSSKADISLKTDNISGPWLEIDLGAITHNLQQIRNRLDNQPLIPVIKANAYGHGIVGVARHLESLKVAGLCVGSFREAATLRQNGVGCPLLNLGIFSPAEAENIILADISQVIFDDQASCLNEIAGKLGRLARVHIKIDSGLGRIGVVLGHAMDFIRRVHAMDNLIIEGIYTSLSEDPGFDRLQLEGFTDICLQAENESIPVGLKHAASSAGILTSPSPTLDMARPGITVFGHYPSHREYQLRKIDLRPALTLKARVACVKELRPGDSVSYHQAYRAQTRETVVTGAIGYADGYPASQPGGRSVLIDGNRLPLIAPTSANHIYIGDASHTTKVGSEIVLIGHQGNKQISVEQLAALGNISEYQLLSGINPTLPRLYLNG